MQSPSPQTAILAFTADGDHSFYNGLFGIICGAVATIIGISMMIHIVHVQKGHYIKRYAKKLTRALRQRDIDDEMLLVKLEDYGPKHRWLHIETSERLLTADKIDLQAYLEQQLHIKIILSSEEDEITEQLQIK